LLQVDSWNGTDDEQSTAKREVEELVYRLLTDKCCPPAGPPRRALPPGIEWDGYNLHICMEELDMPGDIYIYQGCCPDGTSGGVITGDGGTSTGGNEGVPLGSQATKCDVATYLLPYINAQALEWLQAVDTLVTAGATMTDAILGTTVSIFDPTDVSTTFIDNVAEILSISLDPLIVALADSDLILRVQENWWGKATATHYETFTRADLTRVGSSYPLMWSFANTTSPRLFMEVFTRFADVNRVNTRILLARGQANQVLCEYLANANGENYENTPTVTPPDAEAIVVDLAGGKTLYYWENPVTFTEPSEEFILQANFGDTFQNRIIAARVKRGSAGPEQGGMVLAAPGSAGSTPQSNFANSYPPTPSVFQIGTQENLDLIEPYISDAGADVYGLTLNSVGVLTQIALSAGQDYPGSVENPGVSEVLSVAIVLSAI
jgi:hypothetical protein